DAQGVIHGCVNKTSGALRVVDSATQSCATSETPLNWNQRGINWRGTWASGTTYAAGDSVAYQGSSYMALVATTTTPTNTANWAVLALRGATGATGPAGLTWKGAWSYTPAYAAHDAVSSA